MEVQVNETRMFCAWDFPYGFLPTTRVALSVNFHLLHRIAISFSQSARVTGPVNDIVRVFSIIDSPFEQARVTVLIVSCQFYRPPSTDGFADGRDDFQVAQARGNVARLRAAAAFAQKGVEKMFRRGNNFPFRCD